MACRQTLAASGLLALAVAGCAAPGVPGTGGVQITLSSARRVQYVSADIQALKVTITSQASGATYARSFPGTALVPAAGGSQFRYVAENLSSGSYAATLEAFLDTGQTRPAGSSSATFAVTAFATTPVVMPALVLAATPIGDWRVALDVTLHAGYAIDHFTSELEMPRAERVAGPEGTTLPVNGFTWGNVAAEPGISTCSITVTATKHGGHGLTKTEVATTSVVAGETVASSLRFAFP